MLDTTNIEGSKPFVTKLDDSEIIARLISQSGYLHFRLNHKLHLTYTMRIRYFFQVLLISTIISCSNQKDSNSNYRLTSVLDGILIEEFDSTGYEIPLYNYNNKIFTEGKRFTYSYDFKKTDSSYFFKLTNEDWELVPANEVDSITVFTVSLTVIPLLNQTNEGQTLVSYKFNTEPTFSMTGVIENEANIWVHPPRNALFKILELNPFPYVKYPLKVGNKWNWKLSIGDHWADKRWKLWQGRITNKFSYEIIDQSKIETQFGLINCYEIFSSAQSELGKTSLRTWFNDELGFVKLEYINIDNSSLTLYLTDVKELDDPFKTM